MTAKELLNPRVRIKINHPDSSLKKGYIFDFSETEKIYKNNERYFTEKEVDEYPDVFEKLKWYEYRENDQMPVFVKEVEGDSVFRVKKYQGGGFYDEFNIPHHTVSSYMPVNESEYNEYRNSLKSYT
jgi:hypothetical protein